MNRFALLPAVACLSTAAYGANYVEIASHADLFGAGSTNFTRSVVTDGGTTLYALGADNSPLGFEIVKYDTLTKTATTLTDLAGFVADIPSFTPDDPFGGFGFGYIPGTDEVQLIDSASNAIYRIDGTTGTAYEFLSNAAIAAHTGLATADLGNYTGTTVSGEAVFFEEDSESILISSSAGSVTTLVSSAMMAAVTGDGDIETGITADGLGNYYWGDNNSDKVYKFDGSTVSEFLDISVVGGDSFSGDMFYAPNGLIYTRIRTGSNALWSFNPAAPNPAATLNQVLSGSELSSGPAGSNFINEISWFDGRVGFQRISSSHGYYAIPSPAASGAGLLGLIALATRRRR